MKLEKLKPGMVIYDVRKRTGLSYFRGGGDYEYWEVFIKQVDLEKREALVSWNGNPARWVSENQLSKYRLKKPEVKQ
jgi:hypothetical protein